jgi:hypothetical protein
MTFQKYLEATERLSGDLSRQGGDEAAPNSLRWFQPSDDARQATNQS